MTQTPPPQIPPNNPSRQNVSKMFDRIAHRYDFLNRTLSLGIDTYWRLKLTQYLPPKSHLKVLDLATGTADVLITFCENQPQITEAIGMDLSEQMLEWGRKKVQNTQPNILLKTGDACDIPSADNVFDVVSISFGIRNVIQVDTCLKEMYRVLKPQGRALILEFSQPELPGFKTFYFWYLRHVLPYIGSAVSGDSQAYRYLNQTIETFPSGQKFANLMIDAGFRNVAYHPLSFGIATIYQGDKPSP